MFMCKGTPSMKISSLSLFYKSYYSDFWFLSQQEEQFKHTAEYCPLLHESMLFYVTMLF